MLVDRGALGRVVAVANGKGGVGKTSVSTTLAGLAAAGGFRVLLIDLDPQANAGDDLGYSGAGLGDDGAGLLSAMMNGQAPGITIPNARDGLDVICGGNRLTDIIGVMLARQATVASITGLLAGPLSALMNSSDYDLVVIDCPPGESILQLIALGAARWVVIPTRGDASSLKGMERIAIRIAEARQGNPQLDILGVLLFEMPSSAKRLRRQVTKETEKALGEIAPIFDSTIRQSVSALEARRQGKLIYEYANSAGEEPFWKALQEGRQPDSVGTARSVAGDYVLLVNELLKRLSELEDASEEGVEEGVLV